MKDCWSTWRFNFQEEKSFFQSWNSECRISLPIFINRNHFRLKSFSHKMGLCKCPKRKVTNQFCFEHRVNVCEHCMVQNHTKVNKKNKVSKTRRNTDISFQCVVQSYLAWLQDSDYNPNCEFCKDPLGEEDCVRLVCYHLYHWVCLGTASVIFHSLS